MTQIGYINIVMKKESNVVYQSENGEPRFHNFSLRRRNQKYLHPKRYHRRETVESVFKAIKTKFGASVSSIKISAQRAELYCRAIAYNRIFVFQRLFERSLV